MRVAAYRIIWILPVIVIVGCGKPSEDNAQPDTTPADIQADFERDVSEAESNGEDEQDGGAEPTTMEPSLREPVNEVDVDAVVSEGNLVVVVLNTHSFQEGDDSLDKLQWIGEGLAALEADLIGLNEVMSGTFWAHGFGGAEYDGAELIRTALEEASGDTYYTARHGFAHWDDGEEMSNVLLSRFPIIESGHRLLTTTDYWPAPDESRSVLYARVEVPQLGLVNVFVTHTFGFESADTFVQIDEVKDDMAERFRDNEALDLLLGDLNVPSGSDAYEYWLDAPPFRLIDTYAAANPENVDDSTVVDGDVRIDYIMAGEGWDISENPDRFTSTLVFDGSAVNGQVLPIVSDHKGVVTTFILR